MRRIILGLIITGFALVLFLSVRPQKADLFVRPPDPGTEPPEVEVVFEPAPQFSIVQGESAPALRIVNNTDDPVNYSLGFEHDFIIFRPLNGELVPAEAREIHVRIDPACPSGAVELPVYLRAEINEERIGLEAVLSFEIIPGKLTLEGRGDSLTVLWNSGPAPRGVFIYYRPPGEEEWRLWSETPRLRPPAGFTPEGPELEFKAVLGETETPPVTLPVSVEAALCLREEREAAEDESSSSSGGTAPSDVSPSATPPAPEKLEPEPSPELSKPPPDPVQVGCTAYRFNLPANPPSGKYYLKNSVVSNTAGSPLLPGDTYIYLNFGSDGLGQYFDWSARAGFSAVIVAGGPTGRAYNYNPPVLGDYYLHAGTNPTGGYYDLVHITFYYCGKP